MARMLTDGLSQVLNTPDVDLINPQYLRGRAKHAGVTGELDAYRATQIAEEEGAAIIFYGTLEPALDGLDLRCELLESGTTRTSTIVASITTSDIPRYVDIMGSSILVELGFEAPKRGGTSRSSPIHPRRSISGPRGRQLSSWATSTRRRSS